MGVRAIWFLKAAHVLWILGVQLKRLKLRKNNWDCETYQFDEVLTETASQKRVYEVVAKPVVEVFILFLFTLCSASHLLIWSLAFCKSQGIRYLYLIYRFDIGIFALVP